MPVLLLFFRASGELIGQVGDGSALPMAPHLQASHATHFHCAQRDGFAYLEGSTVVRSQCSN